VDYSFMKFNKDVMKKILVLLSLLGLFFIGCSEKDIEAPDFEVSASETTYKPGDTVRFNLSGTPDNITFYSGEPGMEYDKRDFFSSDEGALTLQFNSQTRAGATLPRNITVLASTDFSGDYNEQAVKAATWSDITGRAKMPSNTASNADVVSGEINLDDLKVKDKPMYLAFRYLSENAAGTAQRYWNIGRTSLVNKVPGNGDFNIISTVEPGMFQVVEFQGADNKWTISTATAAQHRLIHTANAINTQPDDDWIISRGFQVFQTQGHKKNAVNVKSIAVSTPETFSWIYSAPGTYKATFIALNSNRDIQKEVIKEVWVTVKQ
jgi:plastocyanin